MFVRWLGAFRHETSSLAESIDYELTRNSESACEQFRNKSQVWRAKVGLLCKPEGIVKSFSGDCWSEYSKDGSLKKTRNPRHAGPKSLHKESWVRSGCFSGIVLKVPLDNLKKSVQEEIITSAKKHSLPVYLLKEGSKRASLIEVSL